MPMNSRLRRSIDCPACRAWLELLWAKDLGIPVLIPDDSATRRLGNRRCWRKMIGPNRPLDATWTHFNVRGRKLEIVGKVPEGNVAGTRKILASPTDQHEMHQHEIGVRFCSKALKIVWASHLRA